MQVPFNRLGGGTSTCQVEGRDGEDSRQYSHSAEELCENIDDDELPEMTNQANRGGNGEINIREMINQANRGFGFANCPVFANTKQPGL